MSDPIFKRADQEWVASIATTNAPKETAHRFDVPLIRWDGLMGETRLLGTLVVTFDPQTPAHQLHVLINDGTREALLSEVSVPAASEMGAIGYQLPIRFDFFLQAGTKVILATDHAPTTIANWSHYIMPGEQALDPILPAEPE